MTDTVKIPRPKFPRTGNASGRIEHDSRGNAILKRSRATDSDVIQTANSLELVEEPKKSTTAASAKQRVPKPKI